MRCEQIQRLLRFVRVGVLSAVLLPACLVGCGSGEPPVPKSAVIKGKVTAGGKPVSEGQISFVSDKGVGASPLTVDGTYLIGENVPPGIYTVTVVPPSVTKPPMIGEPPPTTGKTDIPDRYRGEATSPLKANVKAGENTIDFDLK